MIIRTYIRHNLSCIAGLIKSGGNSQVTKRIRGKKAKDEIDSEQ